MSFDSVSGHYGLGLGLCHWPSLRLCSAHPQEMDALLLPGPAGRARRTPARDQPRQRRPDRRRSRLCRRRDTARAAASEARPRRARNPPQSVRPDRPAQPTPAAALIDGPEDQGSSTMVWCTASFRMVKSRRGWALLPTWQQRNGNPTVEPFLQMLRERYPELSTH